MLLSLVDALRCPADHEESPLVLSADAWRGARILSGTLGCPVCHARYAIRDGGVDFTGSDRSHEAYAPDEPGTFDSTRLAAQLDLSEPGGIILLTGRYATRVEDLSALVDAVYVLVDSGGVVA
ncbi:MAG: Trm112 family protein, partial [Vicinamibacterales bacterium]